MLSSQQKPKKVAKKAVPKKKATSQKSDIPSSPGNVFDGLPLRQRNFIVNYLGNGFNATKAAKDAGFSAKTADSQGSRLLKNAKVAGIISERTKNSLAKRELTAEAVLDEIGKLAFFDTTRPPESYFMLPKISDKVKSLEMLGKYFKLFTERVEHTGTLGVQLVTSVPRPEREKK